MKLERLNYLLTGRETPLFTTEREKVLIDKCLAIINQSLPPDTSGGKQLTIKGVTIGDTFKIGKHQLYRVVDFLEKRILVTGEVVGHMCIAKGIRTLSTNSFEVPFTSVLRNKVAQS